MKKDIHPDYNEKVTVTCSCGTTFEVGSTRKKIEVEVCSACHPYYTGKHKLVDVAGRVDAFRKRMEAVEGVQKKQAAAKKTDSNPPAKKNSNKSSSQKTVKLN